MKSTPVEAAAMETAPMKASAAKPAASREAATEASSSESAGAEMLNALPTEPGGLLTIELAKIVACGVGPMAALMLLPPLGAPPHHLAITAGIEIIGPGVVLTKMGCGVAGARGAGKMTPAPVFQPVACDIGDVISTPAHACVNDVSVPAVVDVRLIETDVVEVVDDDVAAPAPTTMPTPATTYPGCACDRAKGEAGRGAPGEARAIAIGQRRRIPIGANP